MSRVVIDRLSAERADDANLVGDGAKMREYLADFLARLAVLLERMLRGKALQLLTLKLRDRLPLGERLGHRLAVHFGQLRLVVERFQVRRPARHRQEDNPLSSRNEVQRIDDAAAAKRALYAAGSFTIQK